MSGRTDTQLIPIPTAWADEDERGGAVLATIVLVSVVAGLTGGAIGFMLGLYLA